METGDVEMDNETLRKRVPAETRITASRSNTHLFFRKVRLAQCLRLQLGVTITLLLLACNHSAAPTPSEPTTTAKQAKVNARHLDAAQVQRLKTIMIPLIKGMNNPCP